MKIYMRPVFRGPDDGSGGIRRVVEAQEKWLPTMGFEFVDRLEEADIAVSHAGEVINAPVSMPWVVHNHGLYWEEYEWVPWHHDLNRRVVDAMKQADHVTAPSEWVAQALRRGMWLRPTVLGHGIDPEEWLPGTNSGYVLWNKTRPDPVCDPGPVIQTAARMPDVRFITTFGKEMPNMEVTGRLPFKAAQQQIMNAGVYLCTVRETFGIGTLEAMASGVPVVGWAWGGQREIIRHKETGWLATPGDFEGLVEGIEWALENRDRVGNAARDDVLERFTWEQAMTLYSALYQAAAERQMIFEEDAPKVSVVMPCYNLAQFLPQGVASVQAQTMESWELIIVDDCSPDNTEQVAKSLMAQDARIRYERTPENLYLAGALNHGIAKSQGRYILPLDADNMIEPITLDVLSTALDGDRVIDIAYGACKFVLPDGETPDTNVSPNGISGWPKEFQFGHQMLGRNQIPSTCLYRREVPERIGGYRRRFRTAEDADFWTRATSYGFMPRRVTGAVTLVYRQREESMSRNIAKTDWTTWYPWAQRIDLTPYGAASEPVKQPKHHFWRVPSYEPAKIAVIIPVGPGHEHLVIDALDSVEAQSFRQFEAIVINDTGAPLDIPHPWAKVINTPEPQSGPAVARNIGLSHATAPLFVPLDADDFLQADALGMLYSTWLEYKGFVYSQWFDDLASGSKIFDPPDYDARLLISKGCLHAVTALYQKKDWEAVGGFDESLTHWEDWDFQLKLAHAGVCGIKIPVPLFTYRKTTGRRREDNIAQFEAGKAAILEKWDNVWAGKETLMACRNCGQRKINRSGTGSAPANGGVAAAPRGSSDLVLIEFTGQSAGIVGYRGRVSGKNYRFGNVPTAKQHYVLPEDAEYFLSNNSFRRVDQAAPRDQQPLAKTMEAPGPPSPTALQESTGEVASQSPEQPSESAESPAPSLVTDSPPAESETQFWTLSVRELSRSVSDYTLEMLQEAMAQEVNHGNRSTAIKVIQDGIKRKEPNGEA